MFFFSAPVSRRRPAFRAIGVFSTAPGADPARGARARVGTIDAERNQRADNVASTNRAQANTSPEITRTSPSESRCKTNVHTLKMLASRKYLRDPASNLAED